MKLLGHESRKYKGKRYFKHWIIVPNKLLETLGWKIGDELKLEVKNKKLVVAKGQSGKV